MGIRIWHQSFTTLEDLPAYEAALKEHFRRVTRPDTEVVTHGCAVGTYQTNYPGIDIRYRYMQYLHGQQFVLGAVAAEEQGYDAYALTTIPEPALRETRSLVDIPVVAFGEAAMLTSCMLGGRFGVLLFIEEMVPQLVDNVHGHGLDSRCAGVRFVGFRFDDVLKGFEQPGPVIDRFNAAARELIRAGADVIIPGEVPLCVLLARNGVTRVDGVPVVDSLAATMKLAEYMVEMKRLGISQARNGYFTDQPPRARVKELFEFYGLARLMPRR